MKNKRNIMKIKAIMEYYGYNQKEMAEKTGVLQTNLSEMLLGKRACGNGIMAKVQIAFPEVNTKWLSDEETEMLRPTNSGDIAITGNNNSHIGHSNITGNTSTNCENCNCEASTEVQELQGAPVIPTALCREGGCDILEYIEENPEEVEISPIRAKGVTIDLWYRIRATDNSNVPTYLPGDNIALASYPKGEERPRPGRFYVVDTYSNGFELGILFPTDSGDFRMQKKNREEFPDFTIERDDIIRIYRVIMMVRI
ncbi:MAG: hypothetical protein J6V47_05585 [Bacteroidaceae bacterium]|nr:hypothetical protein [Bacteroidaceae bacterium]